MCVFKVSRAFCHILAGGVRGAETTDVEVDGVEVDGVEVELLQAMDDDAFMQLITGA